MEERRSPKPKDAGSTPVTPAILCQSDILSDETSGRGIAAGALGLQPNDASSTLAARPKCDVLGSSSGQDIALPTR